MANTGRIGMSRPSSRGRCSLCGRGFGKAAMTRHIEACVQSEFAAEQTGGKRGRLLHLVVEGRHDPAYWMHLEAPADATLADLDSFLRHTWLECCGHLSAFRVRGISYTSHVDPGFGLGGKGMRGARLGEVLEPGERFSHEYDFGTTTELRLKVLSEREGLVRDRRIGVLARNEPPQIPCNECGQQAAWVCSQCIWEGYGWLCERCAHDHECGEEMLLSVVNSPRVGMCGYAG